MENKHTPGPWRLKIYSNDFFTDYILANTCTTKLPYICKVGGHHTQKSQKLANARLISAAPDLLAACELLYERMAEDEPLSTDLTYMRMAAAAIAKAKE